MKRRYASFLIRWWQHGMGRQRVIVAHIQSGEQVSQESLSDAFAWIADRAGETGGEGDADATVASDDYTASGDDDPPTDGSS